MFWHARRSRTLFSGIALTSLVLASAPTASTAAATKHVWWHPPLHSRWAKKKTSPRTTGYHPKYTQAPADEYFGRLQMSILGVRNKVKDMGLDAEMHPEHDKAILGNAVWVEDAMRDWAKKYPFDHWLPRYAFALESVYEQIPGEEAHKRALKQLGYITAYFPQTVYARVGRVKLVVGLPIPEPHAPQRPETDLQRLAFIDGKVQPTMPPMALPPIPAPRPKASSSAIDPSPAGTPLPSVVGVR